LYRAAMLPRSRWNLQENIR